jgi:iron complex outermembrane receptor protein
MFSPMVSRAVVVTAVNLTCFSLAFAAEGKSDSPVLEEIVVSADRSDSFGAELVQAGTFRNARLLDTPLTVNVVSRTVLDAQAATGLYDALRNTAGVSRSQLNGATYDNIAIRGILVENRGNYRLNGSLPVVNLIDLPLENKQRVEVLKGVSALYYGFAPPSGIINMTTKRAEAEPVAMLQVNGTDRGSYVGHIDVGARFGSNDAFGLRFNGVAGHLDSGIDHVDGERSLAAAAFDWSITDSTTLLLDVEHIRKDIAEPAAIALPAAVNNRVTLPPVPPSTRNLADDWHRYDAVATNAVGRLTTKWSNTVETLIEVGQAETERDRAFSQFQGYNIVTGAGTLRTFLTRGQYYRNRNARAEVAMAFATGFVAHELVVGATSNERFQAGIGSQTVDTPQNLYAPRDLPRQTIRGTLPRTPSTITDEGVYLFDRLKLGERWQVLAGLRYSDYENESATIYKKTELTPSVGIVFKPIDNMSLYATYLEGLEEGGTAPANTQNAFEVLPPAVSEQLELGVKMELASGLGVTLAAFQIDRPSAFTLNNRFVLDGRARYRGVEFVASGELTRDLSLIASGLWLDAEQRTAATVALIGMRPENTPEYTTSVFAEYRMPALNGLAVNGGVFYISDRAINPLNQGFIDGVTTYGIGARYAYTWGEQRITTQLNIENLTNKDFWNTAGNGLVGVGAPRTTKLSVTMDF